MDPTALAGSLASHGILGVMLVIVGWVAWKKDRELTEEKEARIKDAKDYTELSLKIQEKVIEAVNKLGDIFDAIKNMQGRPTPGSGR